MQKIYRREINNNEHYIENIHQTNTRMENKNKSKTNSS